MTLADKACHPDRLDPKAGMIVVSFQAAMGVFMLLYHINGYFLIVKVDNCPQ